MSVQIQDFHPADIEKLIAEGELPAERLARIRLERLLSESYVAYRKLETKIKAASDQEQNK